MKIKLTYLWLGAFALTAMYSFALAGIFFKDLFTKTFDKRLQEDMIKLVQTYKPDLTEGLQRSPIAMTMRELEKMEALAKDKQVASVAYFNKFGKVRWHRRPQLIGLEFGEYKKQMGDNPVLNEALTEKTARIRSSPDQLYYEIAVPFFSGVGEKDVMGALWLQMDRKYVDETVRWGMAKYRLGALVVAFLLGAPLFLVFYFFVIRPLETLQEALDGLSLKNLEWKAVLRNDEFGDLGAAADAFVQKVKAELTMLRGREAARAGSEKQWWGGIFAVMGEGRQAIVVDEDNNVLFTNIPITGPVPERMHLLDVVDNQQQDILRLVGVALERPNDLVSGETLFQNKECKVRIVHLGDTADLKRTLIYFEPKREESEFAHLRT